MAEAIGLGVLACNYIRMMPYTSGNFVSPKEAFCENCTLHVYLKRDFPAIPACTLVYGIYCFQKRGFQWSDIPILTICGWVDKQVFQQLKCGERSCHKVIDIRTSTVLGLAGLLLANGYCIFRWLDIRYKQQEKVDQYVERHDEDKCPEYHLCVHHSGANLPVASRVPTEHQSYWNIKKRILFAIKKRCMQI